MKRILFGLFLILGLVGQSEAITLQWPASTNPPTISHTSVQLSSSSALTISAPGFFEIMLSTMNATYYYRLDSVSTNITTLGVPVLSGTAATLTGLNEINLQFGPGATTQTISVLKVIPK